MALEFNTTAHSTDTKSENMAEKKDSKKDLGSLNVRFLKFGNNFIFGLLSSIMI